MSYNYESIEEHLEEQMKINKKLEAENKQLKEELKKYIAEDEANFKEARDIVDGQYECECDTRTKLEEQLKKAVEIITETKDYIKRTKENGGPVCVCVDCVQAHGIKSMVNSFLKSIKGDMRGEG